MTSPYDPDHEWDAGDDDRAVDFGDFGFAGEAEDDGGDLAAALDFSAPTADEPEVDDDGGLADAPVLVADAEPEDTTGGFVDPHAEPEEPEDLGPLFSVTNPPGTLTVTAFLDGGIQSVEISPSLGGVTESELARELLDIAKVAAVKARAGQYEFLLEATPDQAGEREFLGEFLQHGVGLPTPEQAAQVEAEFVQRYLRDDV